MSLYSDYQKKIAPWAKAWRVIVRFRALILSVLGVLVLALGTMVAIKGIVLEDGLNSDLSLVYGESFSLGGEAILGDVNYEYRRYGEEQWTSGQPTDAGTYEVRAVSKNSFGKPYYSGHKTITIAKKECEVKINEDRLLYGEKPTITVNGLLASDSFTSFDFDYDDITKDKPTITIKDLLLKGKDGRTVTDNYSFTYPSKEIEFLKRSISIKAEDKIAEYNGGEIAGGGYKIVSGSLADGDEISATFNSISSFDDNGTDNLSSIKILTASGLDVTSHYSIEKSNGSISMIKRSIKASSKAVEKMYDGKPFSPDEIRSVKLDKETVQGDLFTPIYHDFPQKDVGSFSNSFDYTLDHEENYNVEVEYGLLTIKRRPLTIRLNKPHTYEGKMWTEYLDEYPDGDLEFDRSDLAEGDRLSFNPILVRTGTSLPVVDYSYKIINSDLEDVTTNYDIYEDFSGEVFTASSVIVTQADDNKVKYDGELHHAKEAEVMGVAPSDTFELVYDYAGGNSFSDAPSGVLVTPEPIAYGARLTRIYHDDDPSDDRTDFYNIYYDSNSTSIDGYSRFTIAPRVISLDIRGEYTYDGSPFQETIDESLYTIGTDGLAPGDALTLKIDRDTVYGKHSFSWKIMNPTYGDVSFCYDVTINSDASKYNKRTVSISASAPNVEYDGEMHYPTFSATGLVGEDRVIWKIYPIDFGEYMPGIYSISAQVDRIVNGLGEDVTVNYNISAPHEATTCDMIIAQRYMDISLHPASRVYDGSAESISHELKEGRDYDFKRGPLSLDTLHISYKDDIDPILNFVSPRPLEQTDFDFVVTDQSGVDVTDRYELNFDSTGEDVSGTKGNATITANDVEAIYDGKPHGGSYSETGIFAGQGDEVIYVKEASSYSLTKVGELEYEPEVSSIVNVYDGSNRKDYYDIRTVKGKITVKERPLSIAVLEHTDPVVYRFENGTSLAMGDKLTIIAEEINANQVGYTIVITNQNGGNVTSCYDIDPIDATTRYDYSLESLVDGVESKTIIYDGQLHTFSAGASYSSSLNDEIKVGQEITMDGTMIYRGAGEAKDTSFYLPGVYKSKPYVSTIRGTVVREGEYINGDTSMYFRDLEPENIHEANLEIKKRDLTIWISGERAYSGTRLDYDLGESEYTLGGNGLASGDFINIFPIESKIFDEGISSEERYSVEINNPRLGDVTDCYKITIIDEMTYKKAHISFEPDDANNVWDYDGKAHDPVINVSGLQGSDKPNVKTTISGKSEVETYEYGVSSWSVRGSDGKDASFYYVVDNEDVRSTMEIKKRRVEICLTTRTGLTCSTYENIGELVISSEIMGDDGWEHSFSVRLDGLTYAASFDQSSGTHNIEPYVSGAAIYKDGVDVSKNFDIVYSGTYTIEEPWLELSAPTIEREYNGEVASGAEGQVSIQMSETMENEGYTVSGVAYSGSVKGVGESELVIIGFVLKDGKGNVIDASFAIKNSGHITITPRQITISTGDLVDFESDYDSSIDPPAPFADNLAGSDHLESSCRGNPVGNPGEYPNRYWEIRIVNADGEDVTDCYQIIYQWGTITIIAE